MSGIREYATDELERELRMEQVRMDITLKNAQAATEWPKISTAIFVAFGAVVGVLAGVCGYTPDSHH